MYSPCHFCRIDLIVTTNSVRWHCSSPGSTAPETSFSHQHLSLFASKFLFFRKKIPFQNLWTSLTCYLNYLKKYSILVLVLVPSTLLLTRPRTRWIMKYLYQKTHLVPSRFPWIRCITNRSLHFDSRQNFRIDWFWCSISIRQQLWRKITKPFFAGR